MYIRNAAPVLKNLPSRSAVSAVTGFSFCVKFDAVGRQFRKVRSVGAMKVRKRH